MAECAAASTSRAPRAEQRWAKRARLSTAAGHLWRSVGGRTRGGVEGAWGASAEQRRDGAPCAPVRSRVAPSARRRQPAGRLGRRAAVGEVRSRSSTSVRRFAGAVGKARAAVSTGAGHLWGSVCGGVEPVWGHLGGAALGERVIPRVVPEPGGRVRSGVNRQGVGAAVGVVRSASSTGVRRFGAVDEVRARASTGAGISGEGWRAKARGGVEPAWGASAEQRRDGAPCASFRSLVAPSGRRRQPAGRRGRRAAVGEVRSASSSGVRRFAEWWWAQCAQWRRPERAPVAERHRAEGAQPRQSARRTSAERCRAKWISRGTPSGAIPTAPYKAE
ncbi:hypothetical protein APR12_003537 [Nocardia amikacinitolerans]|nr:hypothetical protein [Nocardia amikacinitolerans]